MTPEAESPDAAKGIDDAALLERFRSIPFGSILALSDLHLGPGKESDTGTYPLTENFLADDALGRLLDHEAAHAASPRLLVLLGDTFDFVRITRAPRGSDFERWKGWLDRLGVPIPPGGLERTVERSEHEYGLRTSDLKSIWKLALMLEGHSGFVEGLRRWVLGGGYVAIAKGNHDLELHWPLVRLAIRGAIANADVTIATLEERVAFVDEAFVFANISFEHGHQYEGMTKVEGSPVLPRPTGRRQGDPAELRYPIGSFVNRYFINRIERLDPFLDNRKPVTQALLALLRRRPAASVRVYCEGWKFLKKAVWGDGTRHAPAALIVLAMLFVPILALVLLVAWIAFPGFRDAAMAALPFLRPGWVRVGGTIAGLGFPALLPYLLGGLQEGLRALGFFRHRDHLVEGALRRLEASFRGASHPRVYAVMGHTHRQIVTRLRTAPREELYVNTGTWIPLWPADRLDLAGRVVFSVTRFTPDASGAYAHQALAWNDDAGELRPAAILVSPED